METNERIPSGFVSWDSVNGGIPRNALMVITADASDGKSTMISTMAQTPASAGPINQRKEKK